MNITITDQTHIITTLNTTWISGMYTYGIVFILDKPEKQLLKTTDRYTATLYILPFHLLFVLSRIRDFYHETKEQVLHREFTKRKKNIFATAFFTWVWYVVSLSPILILFFLMYNKHLTIHKIWIAQISKRYKYFSNWQLQFTD